MLGRHDPGPRTSGAKERLREGLRRQVGSHVRIGRSPVQEAEHGTGVAVVEDPDVPGPAGGQQIGIGWRFRRLRSAGVHHVIERLNTPNLLLTGDPPKASLRG